jgi:TonB family protein
VVISGWEEGKKEGQRRLNVALVHAEKGKVEGSWAAEVSWDTAADNASRPVAAPPSELPPEWKSSARAGKDGISVPECLSCPNPRFTDEAVKAKTYRGSVVLRVVVTAEGDIGHAELVEGAAFGLNDQAIRQVRKWKLKAARDAQGQVVAAWTTIEVTFHIYGSPDDNREVVAACEFCPSPRAADCTPKKVASPVVLRTLITTEGRATNVKVIKGIDACLDQKAIEVVRTWKFRPLPRAFWTTIEINFREK